VTRKQYLAEIVRLYVEAPDTPSRPSRRDWAVAGELYRRGVRLDHLAHAIRLATLRRRLRRRTQLQTVHSLAYYRAVLLRLTDDELDTAYVNYVQGRYQRLCQDPLFDTKTADPKPESRAL